MPLHAARLKRLATQHLDPDDPFREVILALPDEIPDIEAPGRFAVLLEMLKRHEARRANGRPS